MNDLSTHEHSGTVIDYVLKLSYLSMPALRRRRRIR